MHLEFFLWPKITKFKVFQFDFIWNSSKFAPTAGVKEETEMPAPLVVSQLDQEAPQTWIVNPKENLNRPSKQSMLITGFTFKKMFGIIA